MKKWILAGLVVCFAWRALAEVTISNLHVAQRPGTKLVDISYDLFNTETNIAWVSVSATDDGLPIKIDSLTGDAGAGIETGIGKTIVWNMGADWNGQLSSNAQVAVTGTEQKDLNETYLVIDLSGGPTAVNYPVIELNELPSPFPADYKTTKLVLRRIPAGTFMMGSPTNEFGRGDNEPQHQVTLTKDFYIGMFEVTQKQWELVTGSNPSLSKAGDAHPVENVSHDDIRGAIAGLNWPNSNSVDSDSFVGMLRTRTGIGLDLPTEAQWEYACRAGATRAYNDYTKNGGEGSDCLSTNDVDVNLDPLGWYFRNNGERPNEVGLKQANAWGLYDMHGNVSEWVLDRLFSEFGSQAVTNPVGSSINTNRMIRGGDFLSRPSRCRSAFRMFATTDRLSNRRGFRISSSPNKREDNLSSMQASAVEMDSRDYTLEVISERGTVYPLVGVHSNYCWGATITCVAQNRVMEQGSRWECTGWSGTGSVPTDGTTNTTGTLTLTNPVSSIIWNWNLCYSITNVSAAQRPGTKQVEITYDLLGSGSPEQLHLAVNYGAIHAVSVSGDIGPGVIPGTGKKAIWNMAADWNGQISSAMSFQITDERPVRPTQTYLVIDLSRGSSATNYPITELTALPSTIPDEYKTTKLVLRRIPAGSFMMGSPTNELGRRDSETQRQVTLTEDLYMGVFEVTQKQWTLVMGKNTASAKIGDTRPVGNCSYEKIRGTALGSLWPLKSTVDKDSFIGRLQDRIGLMLDLPTEAQWEYACRAGTTRAYNDYTKNGGEGSDCLVTNDAVDVNLEPLAWYVANRINRHEEVGLKQANAWGLYDMHGNVSEYCLDWSVNYGTNAVVDPRGGLSGSSRAVRSRNGPEPAASCRSAQRMSWEPVKVHTDIGLRLCLTLSDDASTPVSIAGTDSRDYTLTIAADRGNPVPGIGPHTYARLAAVTCSVEEITSDGWMFMGWNGDVTTDYTATNIILTLTQTNTSITAQFSDDADGDGLLNTDEIAIGTNPRMADTSGDGFDDGFKVAQGMNPLADNSAIRSYIESNHQTFNLFSSNAVLDVAVGEMLLEPLNGLAKLRIQLEKSDDLQSWTNAGNAVEWSIPLDGNKKFFRVRSGER